MTSEVKMPVVAHRSRFPSEPGMIGHYPWSYLDGAPRLPQSSYERELLVLQSDALAAIEAARVEARAKALEEAAREIERSVDLLGLPDAPQYEDDTRHITKRTAVGICAAIRSLAKEAP